MDNTTERRVGSQMMWILSHDVTELTFNYPPEHFMMLLL